ncbi:hypothetical protein PF008_g31143, partial [Phytophthora fragariae]
NVCVHNYYNSLWEWISELDSSVERVAEYINVSCNRYADTVALSVLPGIVMVQMLLMRVISLYQMMIHKRSVLLTQIRAYRCQNSRMQVVYLAEVTYHLIFRSDLYYLGLATGTLTVEVVANLTFSFFVLPYINLLKAHSGGQQLDRHFRLTWETMQILITPCITALLMTVRETSLSFVVDWNGEMQRKTMAPGAKYCKLNDSYIPLNVNLAVVVLAISTALDLIAFAVSFIIQKRSQYWENVRSFASSVSRRTSSTYAVRDASRRPSQGPAITLDEVVKPVQALRTFERQLGRRSSGHLDGAGSDRFRGFFHHSEAQSILGERQELRVLRLPPHFLHHYLGSPFTKLFKDCDDFAYMAFVGKRCTAIEALLLTCYLFYGQYVYQAGSVVLLLMARLIPPKLLRT